MIQFHHLAVGELREAQAWYAARSKLAAERFHTQLNETVERVIATPLQFALLSGIYRYARVSGFPYMLVFYLQSDNTPFVIAVAHTSRRSGYWRKRVDRN